MSCSTTTHILPQENPIAAIRTAYEDMRAGRLTYSLSLSPFSVLSLSLSIRSVSSPAQ
jgi:hypothetical protein